MNARITAAVLGIILILVIVIGSPLHVEAATYALIGVALIGGGRLVSRLAREDRPPS